MIATTFALTSFAAAIVVGVWANNPLVTILSRALLTMVVCYAVGLVVGGLAQRVVAQHVEDYKRLNPMPGDAVPDSPADTPTAAPRQGHRPRTT